VAASDDVAVIIANRLPRPGGLSTAHLVVVKGLYSDGKLGVAGAAGTGLVRLISLKSWSFACTESEQNLQGLLNQLQRTSALLRLPDPAHANDARAANGAVPLPHTLAGGQRVSAWYQGPLVASRPTATPALPAHHAADLASADALGGNSYAAAWELGRLMVLQNKHIATDLYQWKRVRAQQRKASPSNLPAQAKLAAPVAPPPNVVAWFADLSLLSGLPFSYLVPLAELLPPERIRFFRVDRAWLNCLADGAFSVGRVAPSDHLLDSAIADELHGAVRAALLARLPAGWQAGSDGEIALSGALLRSDVVAGWPDLLAACGDAAGVELPVLRTAQLSPNVRIWLCAGDLGSMYLYLRPEALHFGLDEPDGEHPALHKELIDDNGHRATLAEAPWDATRRTIKVGELATGLRNTLAGSESGLTATSAEFARWMIERTPEVMIMI
jgi:hypothetical protein